MSASAKDRQPAGPIYPFADPAPIGEPFTVAPGVEWLRMPLPFALDHINLLLIADGDGWTLVDSGLARQGDSCSDASSISDKEISACESGI